MIGEVDVAGSGDDVMFGTEAVTVGMRNEQFQQTVPRSSRNIAILEIGKGNSLSEIGENYQALEFCTVLQKSQMKTNERIFLK